MTPRQRFEASVRRATVAPPVAPAAPKPGALTRDQYAWMVRNNQPRARRVTERLVDTLPLAVDRAVKTFKRHADSFTRITADWLDVCPRNVAKVARPVRLAGGVLVVHVLRSAVDRLSALAPRLAELRRAWQVTEIRFELVEALS